MPVSSSSRYATETPYDAPGIDGAPHPTLGIRRTSPVTPDITSYRHIMTGVETVEYLAWRYYGSSPDWWRVADVNPLVFPLDLPPGAAVIIPTTTNVGQVVRNRSF